MPAEAPATAPAAEEEYTHVSAIVSALLLAAIDANDTMLFVFMPGFYLERGLSETMVGILFSTLSVGLLVLTPFMGKIMPMCGGPAKTLFTGILAFGATRIIAAFLPFVPAGPTLTIASLLIFLITGLTYAFAEVGAVAWTLNCAPNGKKTVAYATMVGSRAVGAMLGPPLGGALYSNIGFVWTMLAGSLLLIAPVAINATELLKPQEDSAVALTAAKTGNILVNKSCLLAVCLNGVGGTCMFFVQPFIEPFFEENYGLSEWQYGLVAAAAVVPFIVGSIVADPLEKIMGTAAAIMIGLVICALGYLLLGPSPLFSFLASAGVWEPILAYLLIIFGLSFPTILAPPAVLNLAQKAGWHEEDASTQAATVAVMLTGSGFFAGPSLGGVLTDNFGVPIGDSIFATMVIVVAGVLCKALADNMAPSQQVPLV